jgi:hypothetical protein
LVNVRQVNHHGLLIMIDMTGTLTSKVKEAMDEASAKKDYETFQKLTKTPLTPQPFFLTGDISLPQLIVGNMAEKTRTGKLALMYHLPDGRGRFEYVEFTVEPNKTYEQFVFSPINHVEEGFSRIELVDMGEPDKFASTPRQRFEEMATRGWPGITMTTFTVKDKGVYEDEQRKHRETLERQERIEQKLDKLPETVLAEVHRRIKEATSDPKFVMEVAKAQLEIERDEARKAEEASKAAEENAKKQKPKPGAIYG